MNEQSGLLNDRVRNTEIYKQIDLLIRSSKLNILLIFIPIGIISHLLSLNDSLIFIFNFLSIIPLAQLLGYLTEEISGYYGSTVSGLLNATFGNAVELIISILALMKGLIRIVQASVLGSILSNLLLVLGLCFFMGGLKYKEQSFNMINAQTNCSLLALSVISMLVPAAFNSILADKKEISKGIINLSHGTAIILLLVYISFLYFQLKTHKEFFSDEEEQEDNNSDDEYKIDVTSLILWLFFVTLLVSVCAEFLVSSIEGLTKQLGLSETFVGMILVPIVGNAAEHLTAVKVALKNKMDLAINVAVGSSMQIALFVTPLLVLLGWLFNVPLTLFFDNFETCMLFVSVLIVNYLIMDGKSNWLEGFMLLSVYFILSMAFFFYPIKSD